MFYATAMTLGGYASPLLVESHLGRPTKIEGNDQHCDRWRAYVTDDDPPEVVFYCEACAEREFGL